MLNGGVSSFPSPSFFFLGGLTRRRQVQYFEKAGKQGLKLKYKGPDTKGKKVSVEDSACVPPYL